MSDELCCFDKKYSLFFLSSLHYCTNIILWLCHSKSYAKSLSRISLFMRPFLLLWAFSFCSSTTKICFFLSLWDMLRYLHILCYLKHYPTHLDVRPSYFFLYLLPFLYRHLTQLHTAERTLLSISQKMTVFFLWTIK